MFKVKTSNNIKIFTFLIGSSGFCVKVPIGPYRSEGRLERMRKEPRRARRSQLRKQKKTLENKRKQSKFETKVCKRIGFASLSVSEC